MFPGFSSDDLFQYYFNNDLAQKSKLKKAEAKEKANDLFIGVPKDGILFFRDSIMQIVVETEPSKDKTEIENFVRDYMPVCEEYITAEIERKVYDTGNVAKTILPLCQLMNYSVFDDHFVLFTYEI